MTIGKDKSTLQLSRLRRESPGETDAQVIAYTDETGGQPLALHGDKDSGPFVAPVGDRPSRSSAYNYLVDFKIPQLGDGTGDNTSWGDVATGPFSAIDVREWRTIVFNVRYIAGQRQSLQPIAPVVFGQSLFRFQGSFESPTTDFYTPAVLDGALVSVPEYGDGFRTIYPADLRTEALSLNAPLSDFGNLSFDLVFDVDPYDFVRLLCSEVIAAAGPGVNTTYINGELNVRYRLVR